LKAKIDELETNSNIKNISDLYMGINNLKNGYPCRTNKAKDENGDLVTYIHSIFARWRNHFSQLLTTHGVNDVHQTEIQIPEPLKPEPSASEFGMAIAK